MGTPVIKLAQPGYDVKTCGDENLIYSSLWPLLKIYKSGPFTVPDVTQNTTIVTHDLQFPPMFWYYSNSTIEGWNNSGAVINAPRSEFAGPSGTIACNTGQLTFANNWGTTGSFNLFYYIFALDLSVQYTAPIIAIGSQQGANDPRHVFKIAKDGKDISSNDLNDYIIHSRARSPLIHSVNPSPGAVKSFTVTHNLGYTPMFFGYLKDSNGYYSLIPSGGSALGGGLNTITFTSVIGQEMTIVILKDPFVIDYSVQVNI